MDSSSTADDRWKHLCTFASFAACFMLLLYLNHREDVASLLAAQDAHTAKTMDILENTTLGFSKAGLIETQGKCDIFKGKWVYKPNESPLYNGSQCPFLSDQVSCQRNGRPDSEYEKWSWEPHECEIPRFNGRDMLERLRGKRVIIVGDSLNRNQWESFACLLYSAIPSSGAYVDSKGGSYKVFRAKDYNVTVEFYWSPFLVQLYSKQANGTKILRIDKIDLSAKKWRGADIMVFNTGHWWKNRRWDLYSYEGKLVRETKVETAFDMAMTTWAHWVDNNVASDKTMVFFRSISPEHKGDYLCYNITKPIIDESYTGTFPRPLIEIIERTLHRIKTPVKYLNVTKLSQYRRDGHSTIYSKKSEDKAAKSYADCSHWCLPGLPDTWNKLLYASILREDARFINMVV